MRFILILAAAPLFAADDANAIIQRLLEAQKANSNHIQPYTYVEEAVHFSYSNDGKLKREFSETREAIFIEGLPFHKLIARNDKPLSAKEQAEVQKAVDQMTAERRLHTRPSPGGQLVMGGQRIDLGTNEELLSLFDNRLKAEEEIRGRKAWVIESTPKTNSTPASEHEIEVQSFRRTLWVDETEYVPLRSLITVIGEGIHFALPGSTIQIDYEKVGPDAWNESGIVLDLWHKSGKTFKPWKRTEYTDSKFQKFDVQSTITIDH